ncbi:hypothetical protein JHD50_05340 [Sulfurimonas sp. MAG313]|nr:hypothetical protein [Sulfurimonas sp. MAG313]MDF1880733.1 hypothetical protein [Sulfurimonas sp. MAG313]
MLYTGMIFQFNEEEGSGLIMLADGQKKEFSTKDWIDTSTQASVGQKIAYIESSGGIQIKVLTKEDELLSKENAHEKETTKDSSKQEPEKEVFESVDEYINHFKENGFKLVNDFSDENSRRAILRKFSVDKHEEVKIQLSQGDISLMKSLNGKTVG